MFLMFLPCHRAVTLAFFNLVKHWHYYLTIFPVINCSTLSHAVVSKLSFRNFLPKSLIISSTTPFLTCDFESHEYAIWLYIAYHLSFYLQKIGWFNTKSTLILRQTEASKTVGLTAALHTVLFWIGHTAWAFLLCSSMMYIFGSGFTISSVVVPSNIRCTMSFMSTWKMPLGCLSQWHTSLL